MEHIDRLNKATLTAQQEDDLPDFIAARIDAIAVQLKDHPRLQVDVEKLIEELTLYDTYAQTGYIGMGVNNVILEATLVRIEKKLLGCINKTEECVQDTKD